MSPSKCLVRCFSFRFSLIKMATETDKSFNSDRAKDRAVAVVDVVVAVVVVAVVAVVVVASNGGERDKIKQISFFEKMTCSKTIDHLRLEDHKFIGSVLDKGSIL